MTKTIVDGSTIGILQNSKYDVLNDMVEDVHKKCVRISDKEKKIVNKNFKQVMDVFKSTMKEVDSTFKDIFREITYTGSFFDGLKISNADEYDVNVIIRPKLKMRPERKQKYAPPGFIAIQVIKDSNCESKPYKDWLHHDKPSDRYYLKIDEVKSWLQGVVTKAKDKIVKEKRIKGFKLEIRQSGPAWTLIFKDQHLRVSIDLVPCLEFANKDWPGVVQRKSKKVLNAKDNKPWYAVPKGPRNPPKDLSKNKLWFLAWRMSFPIQEKQVLRDSKFLKYTLRLMKQLRDQLKIHAVASYYIKTLFLWELETQDPTVWTIPRGRLFMYMLVCLQEALEKGRIDFFWDKECNLLDHVAKGYLTNNANQVKRFINNVNNFIYNEDKNGLRVFIKNRQRMRRRAY